MKKLTIVVAYYRHQYLNDLLQSLVLQTNQNFTLLIGNDASPENPEATINAYQSLLDINYYRFDNNLGGSDLTEQWRRCLEYVNTDWFIILGDDDSLSPTAVAEFYNAFQSNPSATVFRYDTQVIDALGNPKTEVVSYSHMNDVTAFTYLRAQNKVRSSLGEYIFRLQDYLTYGIKSYPKAFYSDNRMMLEYSQFQSVVPIANAWVHIRISEDSFSGNKANSEALSIAGYLFYTDILLDFSQHFSKKQCNFFLQYVFAGFALRKTLLSNKTMLRLIHQYTRGFDYIRYMLKYLKYKY